MEILYEDQELIVLRKPAGIDSQSVSSFVPDMVSEIKKHIHLQSTQKGEPYVGVIHRLDKPVSGIMVYAKTKNTASWLSEEVKHHKLRKLYQAVVCGNAVDNVDNIVDYLLKDGKTNTTSIVEKGTTDAREAILSYRCLGRIEKEGQPLSLVEVDLKTGRHHQIRVQMAGQGLPIWGDARYNPAFVGGKVRGARLALCCTGLGFTHPKTKKWMEFHLEPEGRIFREFEKQEMPEA